ncbi:sulfurtransferase [Actinotalea subterranea]|uniref:sulfurtransferase n=1 Tax=Actinotalea subterranea TaxID=2607497 RepID=UPI0011F0974D|nr:sulfurtransferase [Actinotalea subterranea]
MRRSALVQADELLSLLSHGGAPLLVDVRWSLAGADRAGYLAGHLPGAVFCDLDAELAGPPGDGGRHPLPDADAMTAVLRRLGAAVGRDVVVHDGGAGAAAARAWWCLRWAGLESVRVLDGGLPAWVAAGGTLTTGDVTPEPTVEVVARTGSMPTVSVEQVLAGDVAPLVDARAAERFRGEVEPVDPVAGHIPGAASCPTTDLLGPDGRYLPAPVLRERLGSLADADGRLTAYCGSGVTAAQLVLAAHEIGVDAALYPGSWSHWVRDPARPVATGG